LKREYLVPNSVRRASVAGDRHDVHDGHRLTSQVKTFQTALKTDRHLRSRIDHNPRRIEEQSALPIQSD
jgi:hypothetical protein